MKSIIIGNGEIGKALFEVLKSSYNGVSIRDIEPVKTFKADVMHICYPYSNKFQGITLDYVRAYKPEILIIHSTVAVGTTTLLTNSLYKHTLKIMIGHAPIRGEHSNLIKGILTYPMLVGVNEDVALLKIKGYLNKAGINAYGVRPSEASELIKLLSLTQYGINIEFARYAKKCCEEFNVRYGYFKDYIRSENSNLAKVSGFIIGRDHQKFVLEPPNGAIGGHCVLPAMEKMNAKVPEKSLARLMEINRKFSKPATNKKSK